MSHPALFCQVRTYTAPSQEWLTTSKRCQTSTSPTQARMKLSRGIRLPAKTRSLMTTRGTWIGVAPPLLLVCGGGGGAGGRPPPARGRCPPLGFVSCGTAGGNGSSRARPFLGNIKRFQNKSIYVRRGSGMPWGSVFGRFQIFLLFRGIRGGTGSPQRYVPTNTFLAEFRLLSTPPSSTEFQELSNKSI